MENRALARMSAVILLASAVLPVGVMVVVLLAFVSPASARLPPQRPKVVSEISRVVDSTGHEIGVFREFEQSLPVKPRDIPQVLKEAVVAAEDAGFYRHGGVDLRASLRALYADLLNQRVVQGGSTITQQYVRAAYQGIGRKRNVLRKLRESIVANQLERQLPKREILFRYLSSIYLGEGTYGVGAASESYFRKPVSKLTLSESALLAGLIPAPSRYEPRGNPGLAEEKRRIVLEKMLDQGRISQREYDQAIPQRVWLQSLGEPAGPATVVYPPQTQQVQFPYFMDYVRRYLVAHYGPTRVFRGGLRIRASLDPVLQGQAEATVADQLAGTAPPLDMSLVAVEPATGLVKALVGGRDFSATERGQVNLALGGCPREPKDPRFKIEVRATCWDHKTVTGGGAGRQTGSAFKPFTLATALAKGVPPSKVYRAPGSYRVPGCGGDKCVIRNNEGHGGGRVDLRRATWKSINTVYAQVIREVGVKETAEMARRLGITAAWESPRVHGISYTLGVIDVSPLEMASSFGVFASRGMRAEATPVVKVVDGEGRVLEDNARRKPKRVIDERVADNVTDVLRGVITSGTGRAADIGRPAAGKTGTGQNFTNAWFIGYTPTLSTSVWMGNSSDQRTPLIDVKGVPRVYGGTIPAQTWHNFMAAAMQNVPVTDFAPPEPIESQDAPPTTRAGFDAGGPYVVKPAVPLPEPSTTSTSVTEPLGEEPTTTSSETTTSTTSRPGITLLPRRS